MNRYAKDHTDKRYGPKVERAELSSKHFWPRLILAVVFLVMGAYFITRAITGFVTVESGWQAVLVQSSKNVNLAGDFTLMYNLGSTDEAVNKENQMVSKLYTQAATEAYRYFGADEGYGDADSTECSNLYDINHAPGEIHTISPALYRALELLEQKNCRLHYLAPVYGSMENLFSAESDGEAKSLDAHFNQEYADYYRELALFASNKDDINLELLGDNKVRLNLSEAYRSYANDYGITDFVDLSYLKNAFAADYIAETFVSAGYTHGYIVSCEGYIRYFETGNDSHSYPVYSCTDGVISKAAEVTENGAVSVINLKSFPYDDRENSHYYAYNDGTLRTQFVSTLDGMDHAVCSHLICASSEYGCAETLISVLPYFMEERADIADAEIKVLYPETE